MKGRIVLLFSLTLTGAFFLAALAVARGTDAPDPGNLSGTPTAADEITIPHVPFDPLERRESMPEYPRHAGASRPRLQAALVQPVGIDLDVTYISRTPMYKRYEVWYTPDGKPYLQPGTENDKRWPDYDEVVTFTAHIVNKGTQASGSFAFKWLIDGVEVDAGTHASLAPGEQGTEAFQWEWDHRVEGEHLLGHHAVAFQVDPEDGIAETYESNNNLEDCTDGLSLVMALTPEVYAALETPVDPKWPFSAEDWLQKQIAAMNAAFARSVYPSAPDGIEECVRVDKILITWSAPPADRSEDGGWFMTSDPRSPGYYDPVTDVDGGLLHELTHQLGIIDLYNLDVALEIPQVLDRRGQPVQMEYWPRFFGLMSGPGIRPPRYTEHTALALNGNKGFRRGYYGEYLYDVPAETHVLVLDSQGNPAPGVTIKLYQRASRPNTLGSRHGVIDNIPEISVVTEADGRALLPNRSVGDPVPTRTGHTLTDNPLGVIDVVGRNDEFLVELNKGTHQEYLWLDITQFNLLAWRGETALVIASHVPADGAPEPPGSLTGELEFAEVALEWTPSASSGVSGYNVYRLRSSDLAWTRVVTATTTLSYTLPYDFGARAAGYAVTAMDDAGRESGFSDLFWALRLRNPASVVVEGMDRRVILDPQNGYALLVQAPDGAYRDTLGSFDLHLEQSWYMVRDPAGHLVISHPGDWYSPRHSVRVTDGDGNLLAEFGERGSGPGELDTPAGVAVWGELCTFGGPYTVDAHTSLLLHFDGDYNGAQGEIGTPIGTGFDTGQYHAGVLIDANDTLTYPTTGNLQREQGAIEFWVRPEWPGNDGRSYVFFEVGDSWFNRMRIMKDGANNLRFMVWDSTEEYGVAYNVGHWQMGEWHHVAVTWQGSEIVLIVDGQQQASSDSAGLPDTLGDTLYIGSSHGPGLQADAVLDELRVSDIPRLGNSDTCSYRILVADSGNHRIQAFDAEGDFVSAYGSYGSGPGQFDSPEGLAVDGNGNVIVADSRNERLQVLSFDGSSFGFIRSIAVGFNRPTGVATYGSERIMVADTGSNRVKVLNSQGDLLAEYETPNDGHTGIFTQPRGVVADRSARIVVADTGNRRVVTILGALPPWPPTRVVVAGRAEGIVNKTYTFTGTVSPITATLPITYVWQATGRPAVTHTGDVSDSVSFTWHVTGRQAVTVTASNVGGTVTDTHLITISEPSMPAVNITKTVTPQGQVNFGDALTYTLVISSVPGGRMGFYDPLRGTTFARFVEQPQGITHSSGVITGTLTVTPGNRVTVSFLVQVGFPGTAGLTTMLTNRGCVYPLGGTLGGCVWSNPATNPVFWPYNTYLPAVLRDN